MSQTGLTGSGLSLVERLRQRNMLRIVDAVATETGVARDLILGRSRMKGIARARHLVCLRMREEGLSFPEIGYLIGRDHTTIMAACRKVAA